MAVLLILLLLLLLVVPEESDGGLVRFVLRVPGMGLCAPRIEGALKSQEFLF
jgi:hypothetical protein